MTEIGGGGARVTPEYSARAAGGGCAVKKACPADRELFLPADILTKLTLAAGQRQNTQIWFRLDSNETVASEKHIKQTTCVHGLNWAKVSWIGDAHFSHEAGRLSAEAATVNSNVLQASLSTCDSKNERKSKTHEQEQERRLRLNVKSQKGPRRAKGKRPRR
jgi:hypothetical protein